MSGANFNSNILTPFQQLVEEQYKDIKQKYAYFDLWEKNYTGTLTDEVCADVSTLLISPEGYVSIAKHGCGPYYINASAKYMEKFMKLVEPVHSILLPYNRQLYYNYIHKIHNECL